MTGTKVSLPLFIIFLILDVSIQNIKASDICICGILSKLAKAPMSRTSVFKNVFMQQGNKGNVGIVATSFSSYEFWEPSSLVVNFISTYEISRSTEHYG